MSTAKTTPQLRFERTFHATPERLWSYWTDPKKYAKWLNPSPAELVIHEWDVREGGRVRFDMPQPDGNPNPQEGVFHRLDPYRELESGSPDRSFLLNVRFVPVTPTTTRMVVTVTGVPAEHHAPATTGFNTSFDKLAKQVEADAVPRAGEGFVLERHLAAAPDRVWRMWTTKEGLEKWWAVSAKEMGYAFRVDKLDVRVGGAYDIAMSNREHGELHNHGVYTEVVPNRRLAYRWDFDIFLGPGEKPYPIAVSIDFEEETRWDGRKGTKMTFRQGPMAKPEFTEGSRQGVMQNFRHLEQALGAKP